MCHRCYALVPTPNDDASEESGHRPSLYSRFFEYLSQNPHDYPGSVCYFTQALTLLGEEIFYQSRVHLRHDPIHILGFHYRYDADWVLKWGPFKRGPCRGG